MYWCLSGRCQYQLLLVSLSSYHAIELMLLQQLSCSMCIRFMSNHFGREFHVFFHHDQNSYIKISKLFTISKWKHFSHLLCVLNILHHKIIHVRTLFSLWRDKRNNLIKIEIKLIEIRVTWKDLVRPKWRSNHNGSMFRSSFSTLPTPHFGFIFEWSSLHNKCHQNVVIWNEKIIDFFFHNFTVWEGLAWAFYCSQQAPPGKLSSSGKIFQRSAVTAAQQLQFFWQCPSKVGTAHLGYSI